MSKFNVGDRVRIYEVFSEGANRTSPIGCNGRGTIIYVLGNGVLEITTDFGSTTYVHPKQCRKLKPKSEPRRVFISARDVEAMDGGAVKLKFGISDLPVLPDDVEFVEVIKKEQAK